MTLLSMIQTKVADRITIPRPVTLVGSSDKDARLLLSIANEVGEDMAKANWNCLLRTGTFVSVAQQLQADMTTIAPDFARQEGQTCWDFSQTVFVAGPLSPQEWQTAVARNNIGPYSRYQIRLNPETYQNAIYLEPAPAAGHTLGIMYYSKYWCVSPATTGDAPTPLTPREAFSADTDVVLFDETLMAKGIRAYWKREKGLAFEDDMADFQDQMDELLGHDRAVRVSCLIPSPAYVYVGPGNIPEGNWDL